MLEARAYDPKAGGGCTTGEVRYPTDPRLPPVDSKAAVARTNVTGENFEENMDNVSTPSRHENGVNVATNHPVNGSKLHLKERTETHI